MRMRAWLDRIRVVMMRTWLVLTLLLTTRTTWLDHILVPTTRRTWLVLTRVLVIAMVTMPSCRRLSSRMQRRQPRRQPRRPPHRQLRRQTRRQTRRRPHLLPSADGVHPTGASCQ